MRKPTDLQNIQMPSDGKIPPIGKMPPDGQMPPGGQMFEIMGAIMPDFPKWNRFFFRLDCICALVTFLLGCAFYLYFNYTDMIPGPKPAYCFLHIALPTLLNAAILSVAALLRKRLSKNDMRQNVIPIVAMLLISLVICMTHRIVMITLCIFCIPICMTIVFSDKAMCKLTTCVSMIGAIFTTIKQFLTVEDPAERLWILPQLLIILCTLFTLSVVAQTALSMTDGQKKKLINYALGIKEEQHRAEAANIAKSAFLANMSHEIRTPINAILGMNEMILRENQNAQITDYAKNIHSAGSSLLYLVNDVLDISKIESGKVELVENIYETSSFIHDCCNMITEKAERKGLELKVDCNPALPSQLKGDESRLRQIVTNLLSNAAKYTEKGTITLSFDCQPEADRLLFIISVKDTGIGIKEEDLKNLFTQFTRFDLEKNRNIEGTGLGLAISKRLVDLMQGEITVQSIYGVGSSFAVKIPQQIIDATPMGDFRERYRDASMENGAYRQSFEAPDVRVLVVDDVEVNLKVIVNLLKATKIKVDTAQSGRQCLEMVTRQSYDLIFMDHMMPEMNGVETFAEMKKLDNSLNRNTPVIMLTANAVTGVREQFLQAGFADYLSKPVSGEKLEKMILKYLPEDKNQKSSAETNNTEAGDSMNTLQSLFQLYPHVDFAKGIAACADSYEVYLDILQTYAEDPASDKLNSFYEQRDAYNYQVVIHGAKSASMNVGFIHLGEQALALENAARDADWDFIQTHHEAFLTEYQQAIDAIKKAFAES